TLIIEEADSITDREIESILITRYSKASADVKKMVSDGKEWKLEASATFGATVVHRRNLFRDPAMLRRVITVQTKRRKGNFTQVTKDTHAALFQEYHRQFGYRPQWSDVSNDWDIEPAILDCYKPVIALVKAAEDTAFLDALITEMRSASSRLIEEENYLDPQVLLKAIIGLVSNKIKENVTFKRINIEINKIDPAVRTEFGINCPILKLGANQRNRILREDLGFEIKSAGGRNRLYLNIPQLIKACEGNAVEDDCLGEWKVALGIVEGDSPFVSSDNDTDGEYTEDAWQTEEE
ncbi:MAG: hypothetical protein PHU23_19360, partial [Dehalococcoidales bacterium]|nr:hypothetical protein [Dehalococcoidales bacterium]